MYDLNDLIVSGPPGPPLEVLSIRAINEHGAIVVRAGTADGEVDHAFLALPIVPGDLDADADVDAFDLALLLGAWGPCADCDACPADLDGDCTVGPFDLAILLGNWGG